MHPGIMPLQVLVDANGQIIYKEYACKMNNNGSQLELESIMSESANPSLGKSPHQPQSETEPIKQLKRQKVMDLRADLSII